MSRSAMAASMRSNANSVVALLRYTNQASPVMVGKSSIARLYASNPFSSSPKAM